MFSVPLESKQKCTLCHKFLTQACQVLQTQAMVARVLSLSRNCSMEVMISSSKAPMLISPIVMLCYCRVTRDMTWELCLAQAFAHG